MTSFLDPPTFAQFRNNYGSYVLNSVMRPRRGAHIDDDDRVAYNASLASYGDNVGHETLLGRGYNLDNELSTENARVYAKDGRGLVAYRGTTHLNEDYMADLAIAAGLTDGEKSFKRALDVGTRAKEKYSNVLYTGHSLGGAKAVQTARALGQKSIVFNPGTSARRPLDTSQAKVHRTNRDYISYNIRGGNINTYDGGHSLNSFGSFMK